MVPLDFMRLSDCAERGACWSLSESGGYLGLAMALLHSLGVWGGARQ